MHRLAADFAPLYPPYTWIPAFAGMTRSGACRGVLEPASATPWNPSLAKRDLGSSGPWEVEHGPEIAAPYRHRVGEWLAMTREHRVTETVQQDAAEGLGVSPNFSSLPPRMGAQGVDVPSASAGRP
jgi:hypothetical protein